MTFKEVYKTFRNYQKYCVMEALKNLDDRRVPRVRGGHTEMVLLLSIPFCDRTEKEWKTTDEIYEAQCCFKRVLDGEEDDDYYKMSWDYLKDTDFPEWRKIPIFENEDLF